MTGLDGEARAAMERTMRMALAVGFAVISAAGWLRLVEALRLRAWLDLGGVQPSVTGLAVGGAVWGAIGLAAAVILWLYPKWAVWGSRLAAMGLVILFGVDRFWLSRSETASTNRMFEISIIVLLLGLVWLMTWVMQQVRLKPGEDRVEEEEP